MRISTAGMTRAEWLETRRRGIGGSEAAAVCGVNPHRSAMSVYLDKLGELPEEDAGERAYWGTVLEDVVARHYAEVNDAKVRRVNYIMIDPARPYMLANLDREVLKDGARYGYEGKTTDARNAAQWDGEAVPVNYVYQVQHYMSVTGFPFFDVACLIGGNTYVQRRVYRDPELIEIIREREAAFWLSVETRTPPEWDGSADGWEVLKKLHPTSEPGKEIELPQEMAAVLAMYQQLEAERKSAAADVKAIEQQRDQYKQALCAAMGDAEIAHLNGYTLSYKTSVRKGYAVEDKTVRSFSLREDK